MNSKFLQVLPQYHFEREAFTNVFYEVFGSSDDIFNLIVACQGHECLDSFHLFYQDDEFYIIHLESGTIINWYKHLGRTNTCNKEGFTLEDLREFLTLLKEDMNA